MEEDVRIKFSKRLKALRKKHKLTQEQLSEISGIEYKHIQRFESKNPPAPTLTTIDKLARTFNISCSKLIDFKK